jgi:hypothetical protein
MRKNLTLLVLAISISLNAQTPGDTLRMYFDDASDSLHLDSIYPAGCWQVGTPSKPVFTSAFSPGKALVTDTLLPYPENTTCYAEYTLIATNPSYLGRHILWVQQRDMDSSTTAGWLEFYDPWMLQWHRFSTGLAGDEWYQQGIPLWTDSGYVFTGTSSGWETVEAYSPCMFVFWQPGTRTYEQYLHVRFAFQAGGNPDDRDGWMIDNVRAVVEVCFGGIEEEPSGELQVSPNPASEQVTISTTSMIGGPLHVELVGTDGRISLSRALDDDRVVDVRSQPEGLYLIRLNDGKQERTQRLVIQR